MSRIVIFAICVFWTYGPASLLAQNNSPSLDEVLAAINDDAATFSKFKELLMSPEEPKRIAAYNAMTSSGIIELQTMAIEHALASDEKTMRALALHSNIMNRNTLELILSINDGASEEQKKALAAYGELVTATLSDPQTSSGRFAISLWSQQGSGQVSGDVVSFGRSHGSRPYSISLKLDNDGNLSGYFKYDDLARVNATVFFR